MASASATSGSGGGGSGRRKSLDAEINLVPFIDLLSMCICFLLMTAVWTQLSAVQVKQANGTEGAADTAKSLDLDVKFVSPEHLALTLKKSGKSMQTVESTMADLNATIQGIQAGLSGKGEIAAVMITPNHGVDYGTMVTVMDTLRRNRLVNLGVVPVQPQQSTSGSAGQSPGTGAE